MRRRYRARSTAADEPLKRQERLIFFRHPIAELQTRGHEIIVTSRRKGMATDLLDDFAIDHRSLSITTLGGALGMLSEFVRRELASARLIREFRPACVMAFCRVYVGESTTMASECAFLGVPATYAAHTGRGYTNQQERRYDLVTNVQGSSSTSLCAAIDELLAHPRGIHNDRYRKMLDECADVTAFVSDTVEAQLASRAEKV